MVTLGIIGLGPRGLYALESVLLQLSIEDIKTESIRILLFETCDQPGAGQVWYTNQSDSNWINITERALGNWQGRPKIKFSDVIVEKFKSYHEWSNFSQDIEEADTFPPRKKIGQYLHERFQSLHEHDGLFQLINKEVKEIENKNNVLIVKTENCDYICDDVLLTIGHQPTEPSEQIKNWRAHFKNSDDCKIFENTYPLDQFSSIKNQKNIIIGIRGFGLAMIDLMRELVINDFGYFEISNVSEFKSRYVKKEEQNLTLVPFSLDGLPLAPKPYNELIDNWYKPTKDEIHTFQYEIERKTQTNTSVSSIDFLIHSIAEVSSRVYHRLENAIDNTYTLKNIKHTVIQWLNDQDYEHILIQKQDIEPYDLILAYVDMALGKRRISLDYCVGQVWRHCQPTLYKTVSHAKMNDGIIADIIALDDRSKRYSYGPPIESMQQILALVDAKVLHLDHIKNPDIELQDDGWLLTNKNTGQIKCDFMINSVLNAPKLLDVNSSVVLKLLDDNIIQPAHSKLGIETHPNGYIQTPKANSNCNIAVLGRLAKGSVIGVDAILECFGSRIEDWAKSYVTKINV